MSTGERLLDLAEEYRRAKEDRAPELEGIGEPCTREPSEIARDYESALRELLG